MIRKCECPKCAKRDFDEYSNTTLSIVVTVLMGLAMTLSWWAERLSGGM